MPDFVQKPKSLLFIKPLWGLSLLYILHLIPHGSLPCQLFVSSLPDYSHTILSFLSLASTTPIPLPPKSSHYALRKLFLMQKFHRIFNIKRCCLAILPKPKSRPFQRKPLALPPSEELLLTCSYPMYPEVKRLA